MFFPNSRDQQFYNLLRDSADNIAEMANTLNQLLLEPSRYPEAWPTMKEMESKGDDVTHNLFALLNKTFVTPLEREDLATIGLGMDDVADTMEAAASRIAIYRIKESDKYFKAFGQILRAQAAELVAAVDKLAGRKMLQISDHTFQINVLENQGDELLRSGLSELFEHAHNDPIRFITMKEIYETLEDATDKAEDVADILEGVVMKNA